MKLWEAASTAFIYAAILPGSQIFPPMIYYYLLKCYICITLVKGWSGWANMLSAKHNPQAVLPISQLNSRTLLFSIIHVQTWFLLYGCHKCQKWNVSGKMKGIQVMVEVLPPPLFYTDRQHKNPVKPWGFSQIWTRSFDPETILVTSVGRLLSARCQL